MKEYCQLKVIELDGNTHWCEVPKGNNLRLALLQHGISPYTRYTQQLNCGGRGLCATCGVWITAGSPDSVHWHDKAARRFGYPRLSCQVEVKEDMHVKLVDKWIWGSRQKPSSQ